MHIQRICDFSFLITHIQLQVIKPKFCLSIMERGRAIAIGYSGCHLSTSNFKRSTEEEKSLDKIRNAHRILQ